MQTKDLSNIILNFDDTSNDNVTITANATTTSPAAPSAPTTPPPTTSLPPGQPASATSLAPLQLPSNDSNIIDDSSSAIINIQTVPYSLELPNKSIDKILNDEDHIPSNQTYDNSTVIPPAGDYHRPVAGGSLPTPIVPRTVLNIKRTPLGKDNGAYQGRNTVLRNALRQAAIEGLKSMNDLYDRKEPNMLHKGGWILTSSIRGNDFDVFFFRFSIAIGLFLPPNHPGARLAAFGSPTNNVSDAEKGAYAALFVAKKMKNV